LEKNLNSYDLNHNGNFEKNERTVEMQKAMRKVIADNARTFAPFTLIPVSLIIGLLSTIGIFSFKKARTLINRNYT
ncbi:MAG: hypothetical protein IMY67_10485, partial [Bacteroidetes bacterium]|nr:hypothetical protein [Bacteroidota bacterium]